MDYFVSRIGITRTSIMWDLPPPLNPNHAMEISEFIGRTITLFHRGDSRIPQRINLKMLPLRNEG
ncbi:MAG: hypothetical protein SGI87_07830 [Flavobacteriales bacterium]|nr:hypothetical protein [Flavobacteriales bacterium]